MIIYTTKEIEKQLDKQYYIDIKNKQKEINQKQKETGKIQKYTAYAYIRKANRIFYFENGKYYVEINFQKIQIENIPSKNGGIYRTDPDFDTQLNEFIKTNLDYKIIFNICGKYGSTIYYCSSEENVYPAIIKSENKELVLENEENYDIGCL